MNKSDIGVYLLMNAGEVVYVGQSKTCLLARVNVHRLEKQKRFDQVIFIPYEFDSIDDLEIELIDKYKPRYNVARGGMNNIKRQEDLPEQKRRKDIDVMLRVNSYEKELFKEAAQIDQRRLRDWMRVSLVRAAEKIIQERQ